MTAATIDYYFGCSSPWAYLGHARLLDIAAQLLWGQDRLDFLPGLLQADGT